MPQLVTPWRCLPTLSSFHPECFGTRAHSIDLGSLGSAVWPAASLAIFTPVELDESIVVDRMITYNGASAADSSDIGIYTEDGCRLASSGLTGRTGTNNIQIFTLTAAVRFGPGRFYLALSLNGTTGSVLRNNPTADICRSLGALQQDLSGEGVPGTLPALATFAAMAQAYIPAFWAVRKGFTV